MSVATHPDRDTPIRAAWAIGEYSYTQIAARLGVRFTTVGRSVGRVIQMFECDGARHGPSYVHVAKRRNTLQNHFSQSHG